MRGKRQAGDLDGRGLQAFFEARFADLERRSDDCLQLVATTASELKQHLGSDINRLAVAVEATNGRLRKAEIAIAVLKFAVFTIGGALLVAGLQVVVAKLTGGV